MQDISNRQRLRVERNQEAKPELLRKGDKEIVEKVGRKLK